MHGHLLRHALNSSEQHKSAPFFPYVRRTRRMIRSQVGDKWVAPYRAIGLDDATAKIYGMIANLDSNVGRMLEHLRKLGPRNVTRFSSS